MKKSLMIGFLVSILASTANAAQFNFTPRLSLTEEYTDNLFLVEEDVEKDSELITLVTPGIQFDILSQRSGLTLSYDPTFTYYAEFSELDSVRHLATGTVYTQAARKWRLELTDTYLETEDPISEEDATRRENREPYYTNQAQATITYQYTPLNSLALGTRHYILENEDPEVEDNSNVAPFLTLTHWFTPQWGVSANGSYTIAEFEESENLTIARGSIRLTRRHLERYQWYIDYAYSDFDFEDDVDEDYAVHEPLIGVIYSPSASVTYNAAVGYFLQARSESDDRDGVNAQGTVSIEHPRGAVNFEALTGYDTAYFGSERLGFDTYYRIGTSLTYNFNQRITGNISGFYREDNYEDVVGDRVDTTVGAGGGLNLQLLRWLFFGVNYSYRDFDSGIEEDSYIENRVWATLSARPAIPFRLGQ